MSRKTSKFWYDIAAILDFLFVLLAFVFAIALHKGLDRLLPATWFSDFDLFWNNFWLCLLSAIVWLIALDFGRVYSASPIAARRNSFLQILKAAFLSLVTVLGVLYIARIHYIPRSLLVIHAFFALLLVWLRVIAIQPLLRFLERSRRLLLLGDPADYPAIAPWLASPDHGAPYTVVGFLANPSASIPPPDDCPPATGSSDAFLDFIHSNVVDAVLVLPGATPRATVAEWLHQCAEEGIDAILPIPSFRPTIGTFEMDAFDSVPYLLFSTVPPSGWGLAIKRLFDIVASALAIVLLSPLFLLIAILIRRSSPGPAFFTQIRCTRHGRTFRMVKFRTMVQNAEDIRASLDELNEVSGPVFKMKNDPRVTPVGRFLRKYSLDELPQLFNVFKGDMSLVGPRPPIPDEVALYEPWQRRRLSMRSGCTCLWQVGGRNQLSFDEWMRLDLQYIDTWSLALDAKIILKTFAALFRGTGL